MAHRLDGGNVIAELSNGKAVAQLSNPHQDSANITKSLFGILLADVTLEKATEEQLHQI